MSTTSPTESYEDREASHRALAAMAISQATAEAARSRAAIAASQRKSSMNETLRETGPTEEEQSPDFQRRAVLQLQQAMEIIQEDQKAEYVEAVRRCPDLVQTESNPIWFLRSENYNSWAAALRLAVYWKKRVNVFGRHRAFLPMLLSTGGSGNRGALTAEDAAVVRSGYLCQLPDDATGHTVYCSDRSRLDGYQLKDKGSRLRALFYMLQAGSENAKTQKDGMVFLLVLPSQTGNHSKGGFDRATTRESVEIFWQAMPIRQKAMHVVSCPPKKARRTFMETIVPLTLERIGKFVSSKCQVHLGDPSDVSRKLQDSGLSREGLPAAVGGTWSYVNTARWCQERVEMEAARYGLPPPQPKQMKKVRRHRHKQEIQSLERMPPEAPPSVSFLMTGSKRKRALQEVLEEEQQSPLSAMAARPLAELRAPAEGTTTSPPPAAAKKARKAPVKKKQPFTKPGTLAEETLSSLNTSLAALKPPPTKGGNTGEPETASDEERKREFHRKRNAIYSRRKYIRKKIEMQVLGKQVENLKTQNEDLKSENIRLESLANEARELVAGLGATGPRNQREDAVAVMDAEASEQESDGTEEEQDCGDSEQCREQELKPKAQAELEKQLAHREVSYYPEASSQREELKPASAKNVDFLALHTAKPAQKQFYAGKPHVDPRIDSGIFSVQQRQRVLLSSLLSKTNEPVAEIQGLSSRDQQEHVLGRMFAGNGAGGGGGGINHLEAMLKRLRPSCNSANEHPMEPPVAGRGAFAAAAAPSEPVARQNPFEALWRSHLASEVAAVPGGTGSWLSSSLSGLAKEEQDAGVCSAPGNLHGTNFSHLTTPQRHQPMSRTLYARQQIQLYEQQQEQQLQQPESSQNQSSSSALVAFLRQQKSQQGNGLYQGRDMD